MLFRDVCSSCHGISFRFPDGGEAAAPLSQEDARLLRDIPGRNCRSLIPRCLIPFDYHPIAAPPILYVDESHCLPLFPIATFPPYPRQSNRRTTETKGGTSSSSSTTPPTSWKDFHPILSRVHQPTIPATRYTLYVWPDKANTAITIRFRFFFSLKLRVSLSLLSSRH